MTIKTNPIFEKEKLQHFEKNKSINKSQLYIQLLACSLTNFRNPKNISEKFQYSLIIELMTTLGIQSIKPVTEPSAPFLPLSALQFMVFRFTFELTLAVESEERVLTWAKVIVSLMGVRTTRLQGEML